MESDILVHEPAGLRAGHERASMRESESSAPSGGVRLEIDAGVAVVTIDRPDVRNAIGFATIDELGAALDDVLASSAAVLVLRGGGDRAFVSGGDLKELGAVRTHEAAVAMASRAATAPRPGRGLPGPRDRRTQRPRARRWRRGRHRRRHPQSRPTT